MYFSLTIKPISHASTINRNHPLEYKVISLLLYLYKVYSSILNDRRTTHLEEMLINKMGFVSGVHANNTSSYLRVFNKNRASTK